MLTNQPKFVSRLSHFIVDQSYDAKHQQELVELNQPEVENHTMLYSWVVFKHS